MKEVKKDDKATTKKVSFKESPDKFEFSEDESEINNNIVETYYDDDENFVFQSKSNLDDFSDIQKICYSINCLLEKELSIGSQ